MKILRTLLISFTAAVIVTAGSFSAYAVEPALDNCVTDGNSDEGNKALDADKDVQVAATTNEADKTAGTSENTTDKANNQCGRDENGDLQTDEVGPGTNGNNDDKDKDGDDKGNGAAAAPGAKSNQNHDDGNK
jgi:hypothetical protein